MNEQQQGFSDDRSRLSEIDAPRPTRVVTCSRLVKPMDRIHLVSPSGDHCELMARKDGKGRVYIAVRSKSDRIFRLTPEPPPVS